MKKKIPSPKEAPQKENDVLIAGAGMAGLSLAALLAQAGLRVTVIDRFDPAQMATDHFDSRTIALSMGTRKILEPLGLWDKLVTSAQPITTIDVQEGHDPFLLQFDADTVGAEAFGWIFPNTVVRSILYQACVDHHVTFVTGSELVHVAYDKTHAHVTLKDGTVLSAQLLLASDGRHSFVRDFLGIDTVRLAYHHTAWVGLIAHEHPHNGLALERFYPAGPFAALPFTDVKQGAKTIHRSAIVWSRHGKTAQRERALLQQPERLQEMLEPMLDARYGAITVLGKWAAYDLDLVHAKTMIAPRVALVSDAAHAIHPIAGQGLNLGMRDVAYLAQRLAQAKQNNEDLGSEFILHSYQRARRADVFAMIAATDVLARLFGNKILPLRWARSMGLGLVNKVPPLKRFFMRQAMGE